MISEKDQDIYFKAVLSRDYRFDGHFFTAVKTTGIYCRPVCPARPKRHNIEFFKTAFAAEKAGYRPCLRCRPEAAPQSPAWIGKSAIVKRAISLISDGHLFQTSERNFALKLGVSERHLRRLFTEEIGMTAKQISDTQRLNFARTLITETNTLITEIALNCGFNSVRRFNDAFYKKFSKKPSQIRRQNSPGETQNAINLFLRYRPPYDWNSILDFFKFHAIPGIENVNHDSYQRIFLDSEFKKPALITVTNLPNQNCLKLEIVGAHTKSLFALSRRIRRMFDLDSDPILIANAFSKSKFLAKMYAKYPGMRIPRGWDTFEMTVATVLGQFVSVESGRQLLGQLVRENGKVLKHALPTDLAFSFPRPTDLANSSLSTVRTTTRRKETIREISRAVHSGELDLSEYCDTSKLRGDLGQIKGIGPWSTEYICLRAIGETDAFPAKDLILARVLEKYPELAEVKPWRSYLAIYLWKEFAKSYSKKRRKPNAG